MIWVYAAMGGCFVVTLGWAIAECTPKKPIQKKLPRAQTHRD